MNELLELVEKSNFLSAGRKGELIKILSSSVPYSKSIGGKFAVSALGIYETIDYGHQMSKNESLTGMQELIKNLKSFGLTKDDYLEEFLYFPINKKITVIVLNDKGVVGVTEAWKSDWHKNNY